MKPFFFFILLAIGLFTTQSCATTDLAQRNAKFQDSCVTLFNGQVYHNAMLSDGTTGPTLCQFNFTKNKDGNVFIYTDETPFELFGSFEYDEDGQISFSAQGLRWIFGYESVTRLKQHEAVPQKIYYKNPSSDIKRYTYLHDNMHPGSWLRMIDVHDNKIVYHERGFVQVFNDLVVIEKTDTIIASNDKMYIELLEHYGTVEFFNEPQRRMSFTK